MGIICFEHYAKHNEEKVPEALWKIFDLGCVYEKRSPDIIQTVSATLDDELPFLSQTNLKLYPDYRQEHV